MARNHADDLGLPPMPSEMLTERHGATLVLTLSDPGSRNSLSPQACAAGVEALNRAEADPQLRCVVLRGDGAHFCGGGNLQRISAARHQPPEAQAQSMAQFHGLIEAMRSFPKPVIAAVEGYAAGGGASLALACDLIVAAEDAKFLMSWGRIGLSPDGGSTWHLARMLPRAQALRMLWLPEPMTARQWQAMGLVGTVTDTAQALSEALKLAERLAQMAPNALASVKDLIGHAAQRPLREQLDQERDHFVRNLFDANGGEGLQAFLDKRPPEFR